MDNPKILLDDINKKIIEKGVAETDIWPDGIGNGLWLRKGTFYHVEQDYPKSHHIEE